MRSSNFLYKREVVEIVSKPDETHNVARMQGILKNNNHINHNCTAFTLQNFGGGRGVHFLSDWPGIWHVISQRVD